MSPRKIKEGMLKDALKAKKATKKTPPNKPAAQMATDVPNATSDNSDKPARVRGKFAPGVSGNPAGRKSLQEHLAKVMRDEDWENLLTKAKNRALDDERNDSAKYMDMLFDRGHGKVPQDSNVNLSGSISVESVVHTLEQLRNAKREKPE